MMDDEGKTNARKQFKPVFASDLLNLDPRLTPATHLHMCPNSGAALPYDNKRKTRSPTADAIGLWGAKDQKTMRPSMTPKERDRIAMSGSFIDGLLDNFQTVRRGPNLVPKTRGASVYHAVSTPLPSYNAAPLMPPVFSDASYPESTSRDDTLVDESLTLASIDRLMQRNMNAFAARVTGNFQNELANRDAFMSDIATKVNANSELLIEVVRKEAHRTQVEQLRLPGLEANLYPIKQSQQSRQDQVDRSQFESSDKVLIIDGIIYAEKDDLKNAVVKELNNHIKSLESPLSKWAIDSAERLSNARGERPGSVKVVFHSSEIRNALLKARRELSGSQIYLKEELSWYMRGLDFEARKVFKDDRIHRYYTRTDHVLIVFEEGAAGAKVRSKEELYGLLDMIEENGLPAELRAKPETGASRDGAQHVPLFGAFGYGGPLASLFESQAASKVGFKPEQLDPYIARSEEFLKKLYDLKRNAHSDKPAESMDEHT